MLLETSVQKSYKLRHLWVSSLCTPLTLSAAGSSRAVQTNISLHCSGRQILLSLSRANIKEHPLHVIDVRSPSQALEIQRSYRHVPNTKERWGREDDYSQQPEAVTRTRVSRVQLGLRAQRWEKWPGLEQRGTAPQSRWGFSRISTD